MSLNFPTALYRQVGRSCFTRPDTFFLWQFCFIYHRISPMYRYQSDSRISFTLAVCLAEKTILLLQAAKQVRIKIRIFQQKIGIKEILILVRAIFLWNRVWDLGLFGPMDQFIVYEFLFYNYFEGIKCTKKVFSFLKV